MQKINFQDLPNRTTPISSANLNAMQNNVENAIGELENVELIAVSDTAPSECSTGDKYYNTTDKKIYTATSNNTWGTTGEDPISGIFYLVFDEQSSYSWDGTDLVSVGGGKEDIVINNTEPTDPDVKLWIDTGEVGSAASEITNEYSESTGIGYSANYINKLNTYSTEETRIGTWIDGKPLYRRVFTGTTSTTINNYMLTNTNNIAKLIGYKGYIEQSSTVQLPIGDSTYHQDSSVTMRTRIINISNNLRLDFSIADFSGKYFEVAVEYTKTTD